MTVIRLTKEFSFEAAHALDGYDGPCREIHGHSYRLFVTVKGRPVAGEGDPKCGMVMDFGVLKRIVNEEIVSHFDHSIVLRQTPCNASLRAMLAERFGNIVTVDYQPTCENMLGDFARRISRRLPEGCYRLCPADRPFRKYVCFLLQLALFIQKFKGSQKAIAAVHAERSFIGIAAE